jgi:signal transduction histidine kinase
VAAKPPLGAIVSDYYRRRLLLPKNWLPTLLGLAALAGLYAISRVDFLLFHCLAEAFSIVIAIAVFAIFWNSRELLANGFYLVIGLGCLFAGLFDLIYVFAYPGMSVFPGADGNLALQAKTVAQWYVSLSCLASFYFLHRKLNVNRALLIYSGLIVLALAAIFNFHAFPDCLRQDSFTPFQRAGLALSCAAYFVAAVLLVRHRREFDAYVFQLLLSILIVFFIQDSACAVARDMNGTARAIAHLCQVVALYFVYKAFVEVGLRKPYALLLRSEEIQHHQAELAHVARLSMLGEMAASLAHELNQPLHAVKNYAYGGICRLQAMPHRDAELVAALEQIGEEATRAAEIIRRVRIFAQKRVPHLAALSINDLVNETVLFAKTELDRHRARAVLELGEDLPAIAGDPVQIEQVLLNLIRNGLEAMDQSPDGVRLLCIATKRCDADAVQVDVRDGGTGIKAADIEQVFEPFFTTKPEGMGMGLAISRSIVQAHGGRLWSTSDQARGCTFHFTLPVGRRS